MTAPQAQVASDQQQTAPTAPSADVTPTLTDDQAEALLADAVAAGSTGPDSDDPAALKAEIARLRRETTSQRTVAKQNAADEARTALAQDIGKAIGLIKDDESTDPAKLTEQLTAQSAAADEARRELAVFRASAGKADAAKLLDSRSFLEKVKSVDLTDPVALEEAIAEAVAANPFYGIADSRRIPNPNPAQGAGGFGGAPTLDDQFAAAVKSGDVKEQIRIQNQKLAALAR